MVWTQLPHPYFGCDQEWLIASTVAYYGAPAFARKRNMWPPLSRDPGSIKDEDGFAALKSEERSALDRDQSHAPPEEHGTLSDELRQKLEALSLTNDVLYHPLHDGQTIRVLELRPGRRNEDLECSFHYATLQHLHVDYEALSYVWGERSLERYDVEADRWVRKTVTIRCNGHERQITPNLEIALRHIRSQSQPTFLWVDALCINQEDDRERGHQITLMGSVYRSAKRVLIWIGERDGRGIWGHVEVKANPPPAELEHVRAQRAFGAICDIVNRWRGAYEPTQRASYSIRPSSTNEQKEIYSAFEEFPSMARKCKDQELLREAMGECYVTRTEQKKRGYRSCREKDDDEVLPMPDLGIECTTASAPNSQFWLSIRDLFERSWFWRVWVVQEVVLAKEAVVKWADAEIGWRWLGLAAAILRTNHHGICEAMHIGGVYNAYLMHRMSRASELPPPELSFVQLLRLTRQFDVTDVRDRVYGLLGMKTMGNDPFSASLFLTPDYTITDTQLARKVARKIIQETGNLSILSSVQYTTEVFECDYGLSRYNYLGFHQGRRGTETIPSWVPLWERVYRTTLAPWDPADAFTAAKGFPLQMDGGGDTLSDVLHVQGIAAGIVGYEGLFMWHEVDTNLLLSEHLGPFFASDVGLRLLSRTFTAGRNAYGSLVDTSDEALADFAAYVLDLHERYMAKIRKWNEPNHAEPYDEYDSLGLLNNAKYELREDKNFQHVFNQHPGLRQRLQAYAKGGSASRFCETAVAICERRRLFLTLNGFLGLGPDNVREGDVLAVLSGGDIPFLLRATQNSEASFGEAGAPSIGEVHSPDQQYHLVGECYVEGLMNGEAVLAADGATELTAPVSANMILQEIVRHGNEPEDIPSFGAVGEIERTKRKKERLEKGDLFSVGTPGTFARIRPAKSSFKIL